MSFMSSVPTATMVVRFHQRDMDKSLECLNIQESRYSSQSIWDLDQYAHIISSNTSAAEAIILMIYMISLSPCSNEKYNRYSLRMYSAIA